MPAPSYLSPTEAALVAGVSLRNINRVFDEKILPRRLMKLDAGGRWLDLDGCALVSFYFHTAARLTKDERSRVIRSLAAAPGSLYGDDVITVQIDRFAKDASARLESLRRAEQAVVRDPAILGGLPVLRQTRIPVHDVAAAVRAGASLERLEAAYPGLTKTMIDAAKTYAEAHPTRGRPASLATHRPDLELVEQRKVRRRRSG